MSENRIQSLIEAEINSIDEAGKMEKKYYNPKTGNKVGYARALALGLIKDDPKSPKAEITPIIKSKKSFRSHKPSKPVSDKPTGPKIPKEKEWWTDFTKYKLNAYPVGIPQDQVKIDTNGDVNTHWVMTWKSPKTGKTTYSYTEVFMKAQAAQKWARIEKISSKDIDKIKNTSYKIISDGRANDKLKQAAAIIAIIAETGLRPGSQKGFEETGNRGISTLGPENIIIKGDHVSLNFIGKSYQENETEFTNPIVARYLEKKIKERKGQQFVFDVAPNVIDKIYDDKMGMGNFKIKDLRTYAATELAKRIIAEDPTPPPPLPKNQKEIKDLVKNKLNNIFKIVSDKLNNTPTMAKTSYVHPRVINGWLATIGVQPQLVGIKESLFKEALKEMTKIMEDADDSEYLNLHLNPVDADRVEEYPLPDWWDNENIELVAADSQQDEILGDEEIEEATIKPNGELEDFDFSGVEDERQLALNFIDYIKENASVINSEFVHEFIVLQFEEDSIESFILQMLVDKFNKQFNCSFHIDSWQMLGPEPQAIISW